MSWDVLETGQFFSSLTLQQLYTVGTLVSLSFGLFLDAHKNEKQLVTLLRNPRA